MRLFLIAVLIFLTAGCGVTRTYSRNTLAPLSDLYTCAVFQLQEMGYTLGLQDPVSGIVRGRREITGFVETARRGAARAGQVITLGVAGGPGIRNDEITVAVYRKQYPQGNTIEATAGMVVVTGDAEERAKPTDEARADAVDLTQNCAPRF